MRRKGYPDKTETFATRTLAEAWAKGIEGDVESLRAGVMPLGRLHTMGKLIQKYEDEIGKSKPFGRNKADVLRKLRETLETVQVSALTPRRVPWPTPRKTARSRA